MWLEDVHESNGVHKEPTAYVFIMHPKRIQEFGYRDPTFYLKRTFKMVEMVERVDTIYKHLN